MRENRWVIADLRGKGRTQPHRGRAGLDQERHLCLADRGKDRGRSAAAVREKVGKWESLSDWAIWAVVTESAKQIGIGRLGAHDLRRTCAKLCRKAGGDLEQIKFFLGHSSIQTTEWYLGSEQDIAVAVSDSLGL